MKLRAAVALVLAVALAACAAMGPKLASPEIVGARSEERRVGQEG